MPSYCSQDTNTQAHIREHIALRCEGMDVDFSHVGVYLAGCGTIFDVPPVE